MPRSTKKPDDFFIRVNGSLISILELEAWKPGMATEMGIVEMMTWIPVYMGWSETPMELSEFKPDFKLEKDPDPDHPTYPIWKIRMDLEIELLKMIKQYNEFDRQHDQTSLKDTTECVRMLARIEEKREELQEADKNYSMVSKLSEITE